MSEATTVDSASATVRYTKDSCPRRYQHTLCPEGYIQWHVWAEKKMKTHRQKRCPTCNLWVIWVPKKRRARKVGAPS